MSSLRTTGEKFHVPNGSAVISNRIDPPESLFEGNFFLTHLALSRVPSNMLLQNQRMNLLIEELTSGLPDLREAFRVILRLFFAAIIGGIIGYERERAHKSAGLRTHMLVALGAAICVIVPAHFDFDSDGLSRIIQGLVTGIGFLGGGAILKSREDGHIEGLTTAAGIWLTAGLGVAVGLGGTGVAMICVLLAWIILRLLFSFEQRVKNYQSENLIQK
jgi:putative Mg2+ transporter-C (MgtC) family protein